MTMNLGQKEDFTRMALWQQALDLAAQVAGLASRLPRGRTAEIIGGQLMRSAGSVPANIAEGCGRYSQPAYRKDLSIARGSVFESISWLDLLCRCGHISDDEKSRLVTDCQTVGIASSLTPGRKARFTRSIHRSVNEPASRPNARLPACPPARMHPIANSRGGSHG